MTFPSVPEAASTQSAVLAESVPGFPNRRTGPRPGVLQSAWLGLAWLIGWAWRIVVGAFFGFNAYILSYFTSALVVGWTYRWMQGRVLRGWWKQSRFRFEGTFDQFCARFGHDAPVARPRWFLQERLRATLNRPTARGTEPGKFRKLLRCLKLPWHSFWLNLKVGVQGLFCTYLLTGWGCLLMLFSWEFGWLNSFHKGYEQAAIGPLTGFLGIFLFIAAMFYVPMAQVHQAATGDYRAFFEFRFVWRLIRARLTAYVGLAALIALCSLPLEGLKTGAGYLDQINKELQDASDAEMLQALHSYLVGCAFALFVTLLVLRAVAARVYRSAVVKVLRQGLVRPDELHPTLALWLERLEIDLGPRMEAKGIVRAVQMGSRPVYRGAMYTLLFAIWFAFVAKTYVGEFLNYHPVVGFVNHPLVQFPCFDYIPGHLQSSANP